MWSALRCSGLLILASVFVIRASDAHVERPDRDDFASIRAWVEGQPRSFENEVLFTVKDGQIVRSERFTTAGAIFGDFDGDRDIDRYDYTALQICLSFSGPEIPTPPACYVFDLDEDGDIDIVDVAGFNLAWTGPLGGVLVEAGSLFPAFASPDGYYSGEPGQWGANSLRGIARQAGYTQDDLWYAWSVIGQPDGSGQVTIANRSFPATPYYVLSPFVVGEYLFNLTVTNLVTGEFGFDLTGLRGVECLTADDCDDSIACTDDGCAAGACTHTDNCTVPETCDTTTGLCEGDRDGDGVPDPFDNCPTVANADQADLDGDGVGNACDNCPLDANPNQANADGDACGDACEDDCGSPLPSPVQVNAGADRTVCPGSPVTLDATSTPANATITWTQIAGPSVGVNNVADPVTFTAPATVQSGVIFILLFQAMGSAAGFTNGVDTVHIVTRPVDTSVVGTISSGAAQPGDLVEIDLAGDADPGLVPLWVQDVSNAVRVNLVQAPGSRSASFIAPQVTATTDLHFVPVIDCVPGGLGLVPGGRLTVPIQVGTVQLALPESVTEGEQLNLYHFALVNGELTTPESLADRGLRLILSASGPGGGTLPPDVDASIDQETGVMTVTSGAGQTIEITARLFGTAGELGNDNDTILIAAGD